MPKSALLVRMWGKDGALVGTSEIHRELATTEVDDRDLTAHVASALSGEGFLASTTGATGAPVECVFAPMRDADRSVSGAIAIPVPLLASTFAQEELRERMAFEELIMELSSRFVSLPTDQIDAELHEALGAIGSFAAVDRAYIFRFTSDGAAMTNTHEWCAEGITPEIDTLRVLPLSNLPWWADQVKNQRVIHVVDLDDLPPEAEVERAVLRAQHVQSVLAVPVLSDRGVVGFVGFDAVRAKKEWPKSDISLLRITGEIFLSALERASADRERKSLEAQLVQARSLENVARLAGGVAHDFNNLLAIILNYTALLQREIDAPSAREKLDELFDTARRAADLTRQLMLVGRREVVEPVWIDVGEVVRDLARLLEQSLGEGISLELDLPEDIEHVLCGLPQLEQVILNIALNARDAMPHGGTLTFRTTTETLSPEYAARYIDLEPGRYVRLSAIDDGEGMSADVALRAFEPFFTTKGARGGTGLGLSTVHGIVKQAGGHVAISSELGVGTTVEVFLPVVDTAVPAPAHPARKRPQGDAPRGRGETILVVDDSARLRKLIALMLSNNGYRVLSAATPVEALSVTAKHDGTVDALLTDVVMPQMSGKTLAAHLYEDHAIARVLYISGYDDEVLVQHGALEKGVRLLQKPFLEEDLLHALRALLDAASDAVASA